jgi:hypothetical protein
MFKRVLTLLGYVALLVMLALMFLPAAHTGAIPK